jgi:hypothetical protein
MLARLGAKADTTPRTAASIGKGMAKMAVKRQARDLEEAIETGMVQRKGLGKKKRALKGERCCNLWSIWLTFFLTTL